MRDEGLSSGQHAEQQRHPRRPRSVGCALVEEPLHLLVTRRQPALADPAPPPLDRRQPFTRVSLLRVGPAPNSTRTLPGRPFSAAACKRSPPVRIHGIDGSSGCEQPLDHVDGFVAAATVRTLSASGDSGVSQPSMIPTAAVSTRLRTCAPAAASTSTTSVFPNTAAAEQRAAAGRAAGVLRGDDVDRNRDGGRLCPRARTHARAWRSISCEATALPRARRERDETRLRAACAAPVLPATETQLSRGYAD
jgi:hypothetical protein